MNTAIQVLSVTPTAAAQQEADATQTDLNTVTANDVILHVKIATGATPVGVGKRIRLNFAFSMDSFTSYIPSTLGPSCEWVELPIPPDASVTRIYTFKTVKRARYMYVWQSHEAMNSTVTLTASIVS